jgi:hypothetical protein
MAVALDRAGLDSAMQSMQLSSRVSDEIMPASIRSQETGALTLPVSRCPLPFGRGAW